MEVCNVAMPDFMGSTVDMLCRRRAAHSQSSGRQRQGQGDFLAVPRGTRQCFHFILHSSNQSRKELGFTCLQYVIPLVLFQQHSRALSL
jgi:hypothetical protein